MKHFRRKIFLCLCLCLSIAFSIAAFAQENSVQQKFEKANQLYFSRNFPEAITLYHQVEQEGVHSGDLFYNLANSYYRQGEIGEAIYYYLKAIRYTPRDRDLVANFQYVLSKSPEAYEKGMLEKMKEMVFFLKDLLTLREMIYVALISYWVLFGLGIFYYFKRKRLWGIVFLIFLGINLYILPLAFHKFYEEQWQKTAVALVSTVGVYSEPNVESIRLFELKEGAIVQVKDQKEAFVKIQYRNGQTGWVKSDQLKVL